MCSYLIFRKIRYNISVTTGEVSKNGQMKRFCIYLGCNLNIGKPLYYVPTNQIGYTLKIHALIQVLLARSKYGLYVKKREL